MKSRVLNKRVETIIKSTSTTVGSLVKKDLEGKYISFIDCINTDRLTRVAGLCVEVDIIKADVSTFLSTYPHVLIYLVIATPGSNPSCKAYKAYLSSVEFF